MENGLNSKYLSCKSFRDVLSGNFPEDAVNKMSSSKLEAFVLRLVEYTSAEAGAKTISMVNDNLSWWPRDVLIEKQKQKNKNFRITLRELVIKCCEFFRNSSYKQKWLPDTQTTWVNDENFATINTRGVKRKSSGLTLLSSAKKRKTLLSKNGSVHQPLSDNGIDVQETISRPIEAIVCLEDILKSPKKNEPLNQPQFLKYFRLNCNNNQEIPTPDVPRFSRILKLHNCPYIPLSSDVGKAIIKRENYSVPEYSTTRKLERLEWYINKQPPKSTAAKYEVSFVENKVPNYHYYKFPKRQFLQKGSIHYTNFLIKLCKPLTVVVEREDLALIKKRYDGFKVIVQVVRLTSDQINKHLCKSLKVVIKQKAEDLNNIVINNARHDNRLRLGLRPTIPFKTK